MRKKILSLIMTACMVLSLLPTLSSPAAAINMTYYTVGETIIGNTNSGPNASASGDGWTWTYTSGAGTLTLDNACIKGADNSEGTSYGAYLPPNTTIVLNGDSTVAGGTATKGSYAVSGKDKLTIEDGSSAGVGSLSAVGGRSTESNSAGICAGTLSIPSGKVTAIGGTAAGYSFGIFANSLTVSDTADVTGIAGTAAQSYGVSLRTGTVSGGSLTAVGGYASGSASYGVSTDSFTVSGGVVTAQGGKSASGNSYGVFSGISASTVSGTGLLVAGSDECGSGAGPVSQALNAAPTDRTNALTPLTGAYNGHFAVYGSGATFPSANVTATAINCTAASPTLPIGATWTDSDGDKTKDTLTLNNVIVNTADSAGANSALTIPVGSKIILEGTNIIHSGWATNGDSKAIALQGTSGPMSIGGTGTLLASAGSAANGATTVASEGTKLSIGSETAGDTPKVIAFTGSAQTGSTVFSSGTAFGTVITNANVTAVSGYVSGSSKITTGISAFGHITLENSSVVAVGGGCASDSSSYGCYSQSNNPLFGVVTLENSAKLTAVGDTNGICCVNKTTPIVLGDGSHITAMGGTQAATAEPTASADKFPYTDGGTNTTDGSAVRFRAGGPVISVSLNGTDSDYGDFATGWNAAVGTDNTANITVKLLAYWTAAADESSNTSFGTGAGFGAGDSGSTGCILVPKNKSITLDLNGHTINRALRVEKEGGYVIDNLGTLTICDSGTGGTVTGGYNCYNDTDKDKDGGGIRNKGTLTLTGGTITGNADTVMGGGVYNAAGAAFTMTGGKISANYAEASAPTKCGGGVYNAGTFTMTGGEISGNYSCDTDKKDGGGVYNAGTFNVGGTAKITGNYSKATYEYDYKTVYGGETDNVYLPSGKTITCSAATPLTSDASIGVSTQETPAANAPVAVTGTNASTDYSSYFHSDSSSYHIYNDAATADNQIVKLGDGTAYTVTFNANGHGTAPDAITNVTSGSKITAPTAPTASGYTFGGWYKEAACANKWDFDTDTVTAATTLYAKWTASGGNSGSGSSGSSGSTTTTTTTGNKAEPVIVDGTEHDIGTKTTTDTTTTVTVDDSKLQEQIQSAKESVVVPITTKTDTTVAQLVVKNVEDMAKKDMTLSVDIGKVQYNIPSTAVQTDEVMQTLGATDPAKVPVNVTITQLKNEDVTIKNGTLQVPPVQFTVTASYGGKTVETSVFTQYVSRVIELSDSTDLSKITTAVVKEPDGAERHVPTFVYTKDGKDYAKINSLTNSTYALIYNNQSFADAAGKWYENIVSEMASREILMGRDTGVFDGDASITRAEFAAVLVRALGLPANGTSKFTDVASTDWYAGAVGTASGYGLVLGYTDGSFQPNNNITRQEAMAMMQRAAKVAELTGKTSELAAFSDAASVSNWAVSAAQYNVGSGLIVGDNGQLRPNDAITRAESATVVLRLLQKAGLVDVRSAT